MLECGLLKGSFIPRPRSRPPGDVFRYRTKVAQQRVSEIARLGSVLQDAGIKIDSVAWSIATKSGRAMIEALIDGERRGTVLADLAKGKMRSKIADLSMALEGRFGDHHALTCRLHLDHIDHLEAMIARLEAQIEDDPLSRPAGPARHRPRDRPARRCRGDLRDHRQPPQSSSPPPRTWPPGPACAPATTNRLANATPAGAATATSTCSPSWSSAPGPRSAMTAISNPSTTGTS